MSAATPAARCWVVVPAAGSGLRMSAERPKQYFPLAGATVIEQALRPFVKHQRVAAIAVVLAPDDTYWSTLKCAGTDGLITATGGAERVHSVLNGLACIATRAAPHDWVLVHDAARPCLDSTDLDRLLETLQDDEVGGLLAVPVGDTLKRADDQGRSVVTVGRENLWSAQTPQMFRFDLLRGALLSALERGIRVTDEAAAIEQLGLKPRLIEGSACNIKITRREDLALAEAILRGGRAR